MTRSAISFQPAARFAHERDEIAGTVHATRGRVHWALSIVAVVHGLLHLIGFKKRRAWLVPALLFVATAATPLSFAWIPGVLALISSQVLIISSWREAKAGTLVNLVFLGLLAVVFSMNGPLSVDAEFARAASDAPSGPGAVVTELDLAPLPEPLQRYLRLAGAVGKPRASLTRATWTGRIRGGADQPWMEFTAEQVNTWGTTPTRFFLMHATMKGVPVRVFHRFDSDGASFRVRPLGLFNLVDARGPQMNRSETVTILNDLAMLAPSRFLDPSCRFDAIDAHAAPHDGRSQAQQRLAELEHTPQLVDELVRSLLDRRPRPMQHDEPARMERVDALAVRFEGLRARVVGRAVGFDDHAKTFEE